MSKTAASACTSSESVMRSFQAAHPGVPAYRNYQNPFFRVVAGNFRTKSEAMEFLQRIKPTYPSGLIDAPSARSTLTPLTYPPYSMTPIVAVPFSLSRLAW